MRWLHRYAKFVAASTVLLIAAGGMVTSTDAGLSVPDWPNTYGWFMFSFPLDKMVGGIFYEHGHRMIASTVGFLTIILAVWIWKIDPRAWVRRLGFAALGAVILQGLLGGLTVLFLLPDPISIGHAGLAQLFFCMTVSLALFTSPGWLRGERGHGERGGQGEHRGGHGETEAARLRTLALTTTLMIYAQILLGATMRHRDAGMAIPDFPLAFGGLIPPVWNTDIAVHFAHRLFAVVVTGAVIMTVREVFSAHRDHAGLKHSAQLLLALVLVQVTLGAFVVLTGLQPIVNTAHVVNGALVLATSLVLTLRSFRAAFDRVPAQASERPLVGAAPAGARS